MEEDYTSAKNYTCFYILQIENFPMFFFPPSIFLLGTF